MKNIINNQSGNAIWFILLAVALLGFLTSVISRGTSSVDQTGDFERARIQSAQIIRYAKSIETALQNLRLNNGCSENEISFENNDVTGYINANAPTDESCHIFETNGGAITWQTYAISDKEWIITKSARIYEAVTSSNDDILIILRDVPESICAQINRELHNWTSIPTWDAGSGYLWSKADGDYGASAVVLSLPRPGPVWETDIITGCFNNTNAGEYDFFHTLLLR